MPSAPRSGRGLNAQDEAKDIADRDHPWQFRHRKTDRSAENRCAEAEAKNLRRPRGASRTS